MDYTKPSAPRRTAANEVVWFVAARAFRDLWSGRNAGLVHLLFGHFAEPGGIALREESGLLANNC